MNEEPIVDEAAGMQEVEPVATDDDARFATPSGGWSRRRKILIGSAAILVVVIAVAFFWLYTPPDFVDYRDPVSAETRSDNSALYAALAVGGIDGPFVDITPERVVVAYDLPDAPAHNETTATDEPMDAETMQWFVLGAAFDSAPESGSYWIQQYVDEAVAMTWSVQGDDVRAYYAGEMTLEELEGRVEKGGG